MLYRFAVNFGTLSTTRTRERENKFKKKPWSIQPPLPFKSNVKQMLYRFAVNFGTLSIFLLPSRPVLDKEIDKNKR